MRVGTVVAVSCLLMAAPSAIAQNVAAFDNAGVTIGQSLAEVEAALARQGFRTARATSTYRLAPDREYVQAIRAEKDGPGSTETVVVRFDEPPSEPHAFLIWRSIDYKAGTSPTVDSYRAAVKEKAGNETYYRTDQPRIEQYVQWDKSGKTRRNIWNALASLPSSYPNPCVVAMNVTTASDAIGAKVRVPRLAGLNGNAPPEDLTPLAPHAHCASGLIASYAVPVRSTGLVANATLLLVDQVRMLDMAEKRDKWLAGLNAASIKAARDGGGKPIL
ncbi:hypothetical protein [Sphingomonas sp. 1P08PE]|uniref:hypothetical protein n=1 Tax=Sphingomonas sp. 1P08PE TaxID=554122 RepID=UPI0039A27188